MKQYCIFLSDSTATFYMGLSALSVKWVTIDGTKALLFLHLILQGNKISLLDME